MDCSSNPLILVVDGDSAARSARTRILRDAGYSVEEAACGSEAVRAAAARNPALVLIGTELTDLDGEELHRRIKCGPEGARTVVLQIARDGTVDACLAETVRSLLPDSTDLAAVRRTRQIKEALTRSEAIINNITEGLVIADGSGRVVCINPAGFRLHGLDPDPAGGGLHGLSDITFQELDGTPLPAERWPLARVLRGETLSNCELRVLNCAQGHTWIGSYNGKPICDENGHIEMAVLTIRDVTESKAAEAALRDSEDRYRQLAGTAELDRRELESVINGMNDGLLVFDTRGKLLLMNRAARNLYGFRSTAEMPERLSDFDVLFETRDAQGNLVPVEQWPAMRSLSGEVVAGFEIRAIRRETGRSFVAQYNSAPVRNQAGEVERVVVTIRDVAALKQVEQALRDSEEQWRTLADSMSQFAWMADPSGSIFWYNRRWYEYTGTTFEQMQGWGWTAVHHPDHVDRVVRSYKQSVDTGDFWEDTFPLRASDGSYRWFLSRAVPIRDSEGRVVRWFGTNTDITGRLEMEERLRRSEEDFRRLADSIPHALWVMAPDATLEYLNRRFFAYTGLAPEEAYREGWTSRKLVYAEDYGTVDAAFRRLLEAGEPFVIEFRMRGGDGAYRWKLARAVAGRDADGNITRYFGTITDIHDAKVAEEAIRQAQKLESIGLLAGGIAHDFNNLLVGILGNASLAEDMLPSEHPVRGLLDRILKTGEAAAHLTRQMLAYSGKGQFVIEAVDISEVVRDTAPLIQTWISKRTTVQMNLEPGLPPVAADRSQLQQVFTNLVINAAEAIGNKHGLITIRTGWRHLGSAQTKFGGVELASGDYVYLEVSDTGCGMDAATQAKIFDPFFTTKFTGRGLGLAAVSGIARGHKGAIQVDSEPGQGSTFTVLFPAAESVPSADVSTVCPIHDASDREVVLVVDDEATVRQVAQSALERYGYEVLLAEDGVAAVEVFSANKDRVAVVVLDLSMPRMDGEQALPRLQEVKPNVSVLIMSGYTESEALRVFRGKGIAGFIQKPFTIQQFAHKVTRTLKAPPTAGQAA